jgi:farnesyl-diphosphate farnesyltransferase
MASPRNELLTDLLRDVSRSFYLTLRILPRSVRSQIGLAYLLARTTDTIADTGIVPVERRLRWLELLRDRVLGKADAVRLDFSEIAGSQGLPAERVLIERVEETLSLLDHCAPSDQKLIREVISTITSGQVLDLKRFAGASVEKIVALHTDYELDDYTFRVAGCVGGFWTKICVQNQFGGAGFLGSISMADFESLGVRFGKGLQLVNILRDVPVDIRNGRCYLPLEKLDAAGLTPRDLLDAASEERIRPLYLELLARAEAHLMAGWEYTNLIPRSQARVRLACAWPILIGLRTIKLLRTGNVLDPRQRIKISRAEVRSLILRSVVAYPFPGWRKLAG